MDSLSTLPRLELKYCERCAGLWLRPIGTNTPYCPGCERFMAELPRGAVRHQRKGARRAYVPAAVSLLTLVANWPQDWLFGWCA